MPSMRTVSSLNSADTQAPASWQKIYLCWGARAEGCRTKKVTVLLV